MFCCSVYNVGVLITLSKNFVILTVAVKLITLKPTGKHSGNFLGTGLRKPPGSRDGNGRCNCNGMPAAIAMQPDVHGVDSASNWETSAISPAKC